MHDNLHVKMPLSLSFLFFQCAIILVSFEEIVCKIEIFEFVIENFCTADIYDKVSYEGPLNTGQLVLKKSFDIASNAKAYGSRPRFLQIVNILRHTLNIEDNDPTVVSFSMKGEYFADYNIKFTTDGQARHFVMYKAIPANHTIAWARIYTNWRPVLMAYEQFDTGDIGFKFLDNQNHPNVEERFREVPYVFKRSEIEDTVKTTLRHALYLRNKRRGKDYELMFSSAKNLRTFLSLFPKKKYDESETKEYYFMAHP